MLQNSVYIDQIIRAMEEKNYAVFLSNDKPFNLNIVGIRSTKPVVDKFNDRLAVFWRHDGNLYFGVYPFTTLPGEYYLINKFLNQRGAAILVPGQYRGAYAIGIHRGKYEALVQRKLVRVYRDGDRDMEYDYNPDTIEEGLFGMNIHKAYKDGKAPRVGSTSAGCQVFQNSLDFAEFMETCHMAAEQWGNSFTYTLLEEKDLTTV